MRDYDDPRNDPHVLAQNMRDVEPTMTPLLERAFDPDAIYRIEPTVDVARPAPGPVYVWDTITLSIDTP